MAVALLESYLPNDLVEKISHDTHKLCMAEVFEELVDTVNDADYIYGKVNMNYPNIPMISNEILEYVHNLTGEGRFMVYEHEGVFVTIQELQSNRWLISYNFCKNMAGFLMEVGFYPSSKDGELECSIERGIVWLLPNEWAVGLLKSIIKNVLGVKESISVETPSVFKNFQNYNCILKIILMVELLTAAHEVPSYVYRSAYTGML